MNVSSSFIPARSLGRRAQYVASDDDRWIVVKKQDEASTADQVHNGLIGIIESIQLLQRRVREGAIDPDQLTQALARIETLTKATECTFFESQRYCLDSTDGDIVTGVDSSVIADAAYGQTVPVLTIRFQTGRVYHYYDVPEEIYRDLMAAESKGQYFNRRIRNQYLFKRETTG